MRSAYSSRATSDGSAPRRVIAPTTTVSAATAAAVVEPAAPTPTPPPAGVAESTTRWPTRRPASAARRSSTAIVRGAGVRCCARSGDRASSDTSSAARLAPADLIVRTLSAGGGGSTGRGRGRFHDAARRATGGGFSSVAALGGHPRPRVLERLARLGQRVRRLLQVGDAALD